MTNGELLHSLFLHRRIQFSLKFSVCLVSWTRGLSRNISVWRIILYKNTPEFEFCFAEKSIGLCRNPQLKNTALYRYTSMITNMSFLLREKLLEIAPEFVAAAEGFSETVYFVPGGFKEV